MHCTLSSTAWHPIMPRPPSSFRPSCFVAIHLCWRASPPGVRKLASTAMYAMTLQLFQAIPSNIYTLRPHFEGTLLRIPTSIPDDEMLFDRLRITNPAEVGRIWSRVMEHVYDLGGLYTLNLHPERAIPCRK